jgi:hypothetical protein
MGIIGVGVNGYSDLLIDMGLSADWGGFRKSNYGRKMVCRRKNQGE